MEKSKTIRKYKKDEYKIKDIDFVPKSKAQKLMIQRDFENIFDVCLFGSSGTGKTVSLIISSMGPQKDGSLLTDRSEYRAIFLRRESTLLQRSGLLDAAHMWYKRFYPTVEFNKVEKMFTFPSGAKITFSGVEQESDKEKFKGYTELHGVFWEELTQFSQPIFDFIISRLRTTTDIPLRVRSSTNPGDLFEEWVKDRYKYWITRSVEPLNRPFEAGWGEVLYYWADYDGIRVGRSKPEHLSYSFCGIENFINDVKKDNDKFMGAQITDPILRQQLVEGIWGLKSGAGMYFQEIDFKEVTQKVSQATRIRYWDKACSGEKGDFLAGILMARTWDDKYIIEDIILKKVQVHEVKNIIKETAIKDGKTVYIGIEQEGGSSGKETSFDYEQLLRGLGFNLLIDIKTANKATSSKISRAALFSPIVKEGRVGILSGLDKNEFLKQMINFPSKYHDDGVDASCSAYLLLKDKLPTAMVNTQWNSMQRDFNKATNQYFPYDRTI